MPIEVTELPLAGLMLIRPRVFSDPRGYFLETHHRLEFEAHGIGTAFVQDNLSFSKRNVLRGLHFQCPEWQGKLITVVQGEIFDVVVDLRKDLPTFGKWHGVVLSEDDRRQLWVPAGFAHGFCVTSAGAHVMYKCSALYDPAQEHTLLWSDPDVGIPWPVREPLLSEKDAGGLRLRDLSLPG